VAATDPSLNYHSKGVDIATAAYVAELGHLANPVTTHIQSAEMHNQAVNSLALISARATLASLEVLSILTSSYLYVICQALDLRAMQLEFAEGLENIIAEELSAAFGSSVTRSDLVSRLHVTLCGTFDQTSTMDCYERMDKVAASGSNILIDYLSTNDPSLMAEIPTFRARVSEKSAQLLDRLRHEYLSGARGPAPASPYVNKTKPIYEFVRLTLGIRMHGNENYTRFINGPGTEDQTIGQNISLIHESIRDGKMQDVVIGLFA
jgi:phenylalanine ammonia-lyase